MSSQAAGPSVPKRSQKRSRESAFEHDIVTPRLPPLASLDDPVTDHARVRAAVSASDGEKPKRKKSKRKAPTPGIIYISRVPPGMTPQKVRHLMARWGEVGKIYAQKKDAPTGYNPQAPQPKKRHTAANFTEAWVEFLDKDVAKTVARMLNAEVIGGKKGDRWRDDIWTMKYLSGFKWEMLGEQVAYEKQAHQSRLRAEITRAKTEQGEYLRNVELARVLDKRKAKKAAQGGGESSQDGNDKTTEEGKSASGGARRRRGTGKGTSWIGRTG